MTTTFDAEAFLAAVDRAAAGEGEAEEALIAPGDGVLVACSGGPDSTALACALAALEARARRGWRLELGHVHHGLRGEEADRDRDFARDVAARLGMPFHERHIDARALRAEEGGSLEEVGRRERYRFFAETARARGLAKVATAHHRDDQLETVLQRILRGSGIRGIAGIPRRRRLAEGVEVVRPLLSVGRAELRDYLGALGIEAREDRTNALHDAFRNRVRHEALPFLRGLAPQVDRSLERLQWAAAQAHEMIDGEVARRLDAAGIAPRLPLRVPLALLRETPPPLRAVLLLRAVERATGEQLLWIHADGLLGLARAAGSGGTVHLPGGLRAAREYQDVVVDRAPPPGSEATREPPRVRLAVPGRTEAPALGIAVLARVAGAGAERLPLDAKSGARFDLASLPGPLVLRHPLRGDFFYPKGGIGRKKLSDYFVDSKVPRAARAQAVVLDAGGEVAWLVGFRQDGRFAETRETVEALELTVEPLA
jgi:tRNA(Ile)-lysidine synthase